MDLKVSVSIKNVRKEFKVDDGSTKVVIHGLSLDIYENQITALLGHNGAGKSTLISALTGLISLTSGDAIVSGKSIKNEMKEVREHYGVCPQHDVLWDALTVQEHLYIFACLHAWDEDTINDRIDCMIDEVGLNEKRHVASCDLSGGMKRKLSIANAFIGGSEVVLLDEPTSGMDPYSRRFTWNLLRKFTQHRTIIMTTHFLDEAELLCDRIAIMSDGKLLCCGSSLFLKSTYGSGYTLNVSKLKDSHEDESKLVSFVNSYVPECDVLSSSGSEIQIQLPFDEVSSFPKLLCSLDSNLTNLGIESYGITMTTLEDVFLQLNNGTAINRKVDRLSPKIKNLQNINPCSSKEVLKLRSETVSSYSHFYQLIYKRYLCSTKDLRGKLIEILLPMFVVTICTFILAIKMPIMPPLLLKPEVIFGTNTSIIYPQNFSAFKYFGKDLLDYIMLSDSLIAHSSPASNLIDLSAQLLNSSSIASNSYWGAFNTIPLKNNEEIIQIMHNSSSYHALPTFMSTISQAKLRIASNNNKATIDVINHPLSGTSSLPLLTTTTLSLICCLFILIPFCFLPSNYAYFVVREKAMKVKHLHLISGVKPWVYWLSTYAWDMVSYFIVCSCVMVVFAIFNDPVFLNFSLYGLFILYGFSVIPLTYLYTFAYDNYSFAQVGILSIHFGTGFCLVIFWFVFSKLADSETINILSYIFEIFPSFSLGRGLVSIQMLNIGNMVYGTNNHDYLALNLIGRSYIFLLVTGPLYFLITLLVEYNSFVQLYNYFNYSTVKLDINALVELSNVAKPMADSEYSLLQDDSAKIDIEKNVYQIEDSDVKLERESALSYTSKSKNKPALLVQNIRKVYKSSNGAEKIAVHDLCLALPVGQAFGLLGINGAGKSTTMNLLTRDISATSGRAYLNGYNICTDLENARQDIGFCPQWDPLLMELTARETLTFYCHLRGILSSRVDELVIALIDSLGLNKFADYNCGSYSGGNRRKLSLGIALIGNPNVVFLDEPSSGMDPKARRFMWSLIQDLAKDHCVVLTTHSMAECEATCSKLAIMISGQLSCIGSPQHLKFKYGDGYTLELTTNIDRAEEIIDWVHSNILNSDLEEWHGNHCKFKISRLSNSLGELFDILESNKYILEIDDYSLSQSSLESIFIQMAQKQSEEYLKN